MSLPNAHSSNSNNNHTASPVYSNNNSSNKSVIKKSSKNDLMRAAVGLLLKQKNYVVSRMQDECIVKKLKQIFFVYREAKSFDVRIFSCSRTKVNSLSTKCWTQTCMAGTASRTQMSR